MHHPRIVSSLLTSVVVVVSLAVQGWGMVLPHGQVNSVHDDRVPGVLIVNFRTSAIPTQSKWGATDAIMGIASVDALNTRWGLRGFRALFPGAKAVAAPFRGPEMRGFHFLEFDPGIDLDAAAAEYQSDPNVESVEFDFYAYVMRTPNDPYYSQMWGLNQAADHDIDAPDAWGNSVGNSVTILADTDTGTLYSHEDLIDNIWVNSGEDLDHDGVVMDADDANGIDDDGNGYIDDFVGYDFVSGGSSVWPGEDGSTKDNDPKDFNGHGTHTSGTIAATTNNGKGVSGVAGGFGPLSEPGCRLMCLRMGYSFNDGGYENGRTQMSFVAEAFRYATDNGAVAINYSFGSSGGGGIEAATDYAVANGVVICAAAGNDNSSSLFGYLQLRTDVVCVASTNSSDTKSSFSNYGTPVDVSAPGSSILSTVSNHYVPGYAVYGGTSMAAPHVVGLVGLIRSLNPLLTRQEVVDMIVNNADNIDGLNPNYAGKLGSGRINAARSTQNLASANFSALPEYGDAPLTVQFSDISSTPPTSWHWDFGDGDSSTLQNPVHTYTTPGSYTVTLNVETAIGIGTKTKANFVAALADTIFAQDAMAVAGLKGMVTLWGRNTQSLKEIVLPVIVSNIPQVAFLDSIVTTGCRTSYFEGRSVVFDNPFYGEKAVRLIANTGGGSPPLEPGYGPIAKVWFQLRNEAAKDDSLVVSVGPLGSYTFQTISPTLAFVPRYDAGALVVAGAIGDLNRDGVADVLDLTTLIDVVFLNFSPPVPGELGDINCDGLHDVMDVVVLIDYIFGGGSAPCS